MRRKPNDGVDMQPKRSIITMALAYSVHQCGTP